MRYKIEITLFNYTNHPKCHDIVVNYFYHFDDIKDAMIALLRDTIEEVNNLNNPYETYKEIKKIYSNKL